MEHSIRHGLSLEQAKLAARKAIETYASRFAKYSPQVDWRGDAAATIGITAKGMSLKGALSIEAERYVVQVDVPFLLKPLTSRAVSVVERETAAWIQKAKNGEL